MTHVLSWASNENVSTGTNTEAEEGRYRRQTEFLIGEIENEVGPAAIIRDMDRDLETNPTPSSSTLPTDSVSPTTSSTVVDGTQTAEVENCTNENHENGSKQANSESPSTNPELPLTPSTPSDPNEEPWKIKIKYLNDDMKVVEAKPSQSLGEFKKQNFADELAANKLVRLVFNGKVLQPDGASLRSCALFENCVVHCLVHNMPANANRMVSPQSPPVNPNEMQIQRYAGVVVGQAVANAALGVAGGGGKWVVLFY